MKKSPAIKNPELSQQWHPTKNGDLTPNDITAGSGKKVWWQCEKGHEWEAPVNNRSNGSGCPFCVGKRVCIDNSLQSLNPDIAKQWHPTKNDLAPSDVTAGSGKKVWWQCDKGHEWESTIAGRNNGVGCPFCSGKRACIENCLQTINPELSKQWHPTKNGDLTPSDVTTGSKKIIWWQCDKGHEWKSTINGRSNGFGCPFCAGQRVCADNCLQTLYPDLSKQWHTTKNGNLTPNDLTTGTNKKVWWQCNKGHEWEAAISKRVSGGNCPICNQENHTSFPEQAIYFYVKTIFNDTLNRHKYNYKWEIDVFVPSLKFGIEYDGVYYHKDKGISDLIKEKHIADQGISLLRVKEVKENISNCYRKDNIIYCYFQLSENRLNEVIRNCFGYISENISHETCSIDIDVKRDRYKIYDLFIKSEKDRSLLLLYHELSKQWHPTKNSKIQPDMIKSNSKKKVWWLCEKGHEWEAVVCNRAKGSGCPYCSGAYACLDNSLQTLNPELSKQWHPTKNGSLTPNDVTTGSGEKVWWQCEKGHEWKSIIADRNNGVGCPYCTGKRVCLDNSLHTLNPELSKQWHPTKNGSLTPTNVTKSSGKRVWWRCGKGHEWEATVNSRYGGNGCPFCSGRRVCADNCLQTLNPKLSLQWHPTKNADLTPKNVTEYSHKKVWWLCEKNHEWEARIADRSKGIGCPYCYRVKTKK